MDESHQFTAALPFQVRRSDDTIRGGEITSTTETVHGLLRLDAEHLVIQWRLHRATDRYGSEISSNREVEAVREVSIPLDQLAGASLSRRWWHFGRGATLVLTARDLAGLEAVAGPIGLGLDHPAELRVRLRRGDLEAGRNFVAELQLALAERALRLAGGVRPERLP